MKTTTFVTALLFVSSNLFAIDKGIVAKKGEFPSVVKFARQIMLGAAGHCTGTLLSPTILITAAHCVDRYDIKSHIVSRAGDVKGKLSHGFKRKIKAKRLHFLQEYNDIETEVDLLTDYFKKPSFQNRSFEERYELMSRQRSLIKRRINLDIAFVELDRPQEIAESDLSKISCTKLEELTKVSMVGFGKNVPKTGGENKNSSYVLQYGKNMYMVDENYIFRAGSGNVLNLGDSGGPLFKEMDSSYVYGIASYITLDNANISTMTTYSSTASEEAKEIYRSIIDDHEASKELKAIVSECL